MKNILTYSGPEDKPTLLDIIWPRQELRIEPEFLRESLGYVTRISRKSYGQVDSEVGPVVRMKFCCTKPGRYESDGKKFYGIKD